MTRQEKQERFLVLRSQGMTIKAAMAEIGMTKDAYYKWRKLDPLFVEMEARFNGLETAPADQKMDLPTFRKIVLGRETFDHMLQWTEWVNDPDSDHIMVLVPPECGKTTWVVDYILWRIYLNPKVQIGYCSRTGRHSIKQVGKIRRIIEGNSKLNDLCGGLVPGKDDPHPWREEYFVVRTRSWDLGSDEADYTLSAYGSGAQIEGSRFDIIIFDDPDGVNIGPADRDRIYDVIIQAGETRLGTSGRQIIIGNRQGFEDVYGKILADEEEDPGLWKIYIQSAVQFRDDQITDCIWPEKFGLPKDYPTHQTVKIDGPWTMERAAKFFEMKMRRMKKKFWLVYQNDPVPPEGKDFTRELVDRPLSDAYPARYKPMDGITICGMDPATVGGACVMAYHLLPPDENGVRRRLLMDMEWGEAWRQQGCVDRIRRYGEKYKPKFWVIDRQGGNRYLTEDPLVRKIIADQGAQLIDITTGSNKEYGDFTVSSLVDLFNGEVPTLILPGGSKEDREMSVPLRDQLVDYYPGTKKPHDAPMNLWYCERVIRERGLDKMGTAKHTKLQNWKSPYGGDWKGQGSWGFKRPGRR